MKVNHKSGVLTEPYFPPAQIGKNETAGSRTRTGHAGSGDMAAGDRVSMSRNAVLLAEGMRTAQNSPDVRTDRVASLRDRIENGAYAINSKELALNLLREEPGLFNY